MNDQIDNTYERDIKIAENEASREMVSSIRVSTWAIAAAIVLGLMLLFYAVSR